MDDLELVRQEVEALFVVDEQGRLLRYNDPDQPLAPRFHLAGGPAGNVAHFRHDLSAETVGRLESLIAEESLPLDATRPPRHLDEYVRVLAAEGPIERVRRGLLWVFP